ncbi:MAG: adenylosuccinate lyase, partial [Bacteroidota bacterium]
DVLLSTNFDWLIGPYRAATKVFAMTNVYYLGKDFDWVHPELTSVLQETLSEGSTAYQNRGSKILKRLAEESR